MKNYLILFLIFLITPPSLWGLEIRNERDEDLEFKIAGHNNGHRIPIWEGTIEGHKSKTLPLDAELKEFNENLTNKGVQNAYIEIDSAFLTRRSPRNIQTPIINSPSDIHWLLGAQIKCPPQNACRIIMSPKSQ